MRKGQGLMETIVALGVIMTGLVSIVSLTISNLNAERDAATRYQAANLAREAIELIRNMRDSNWVSGADAWHGITLGENIVPIFNPSEPETVALQSGGDVRVMKCSDGHLVQGSRFCTGPTPFSRTLTVVVLDCENPVLNFTPAQCGGEIKKDNPIALAVTAKVTWQTSDGGQREITLDEIFYDWR